MRLSTASLARLPADIERPTYDLDRVHRGVVHFGPGAFHRAHQADAFDRLLNEDPRWGIVGVSLNSSTLAEALTPQQFLYTLALRDSETRLRVIGSIRDVHTKSEPKAIQASLASPTTRVISATVTEKGYTLDEHGMLDFQHPAIRHDLEKKGAPQSLVGWLVAGLGARRRARVQGVTVLSCDNLAGNGTKLRAATLSLAAEVDPETARWIADEVRFPNSMVDSITPATDEILRKQIAAALHVEDAWPVQREPFTQWVIEDDFAGERPGLEVAGVAFTDDVHPFEAAKLRLLNGAHSTLAYVGLALGHETVAGAMRDARLADFVGKLMREDIAPSLKSPPGLLLDDYIDAVLARFANPAIKHNLAQIAWDGSQKLPQRLLGTIRDALRQGRSLERLAVPIAAWLKFLQRAAARNEAITDPLGPRLLALSGDWRAIITTKDVFGELGGVLPFVDAVAAAMEKDITALLES